MRLKPLFLLNVAIASLGAASQGHATSLNEAMAAAYMNNPELKAERESLEATAETVASAVSLFRPTIRAGYEKGYEEAKFGDQLRDSSTPEELTATVSQPLFRGFGSINEYRRSRYLTRQAQSRLESTQQELLLDTVIAYMDLVRDKALRDLAENNLSVLKRQLDATLQQFDVGEKTRTDVSQSQARVSSAESEFIRARGNYETSAAIYQQVTQLEADHLHMPEYLPETPATLEELTERTLASNPRLNQADHAVETAEKNVWVRGAQLLPTVDLIGRYRDTRDSVSTLGGTHFEQSEIMLTVGVPLYQSGSEYARVRQAKNELQREKFLLQSLRNESIANARRVWQTYLAAIASTDSNKEAIHAAEVALDGVKQEAQYGARTTLDILDAEQELFSARVALVRSQRDAIVSLYNMLAVGGLLTPHYLGLEVEPYDNEKYLKEHMFDFVGFDADS